MRASAKRHRLLDSIACNSVALASTAFVAEDELSLLALQGGESAFVVSAEADARSPHAQAQALERLLDIGATHLTPLDERPSLLHLGLSTATLEDLSQRQ